MVEYVTDTDPVVVVQHTNKMTRRLEGRLHEDETVPELLRRLATEWEERFHG